MSQRIYDLAKEAASKAVEHDQKNEYNQAVSQYLRAFDLLMSLVKYTDNKRLNNYYAQTAEKYLNRVYVIKDKRNIASSTRPLSMSDEQREIIEGTILMEKPDVKWEDIAGLENAKRAVNDSVILPMKRPDLFKGRESYQAMLLHGPPGCGKTLLAKAAANECDLPFFSLSAADIMDKYVGESEKRIQSLFQQARGNQPSIIFLDEFDSLSPGSSSESSPVQDRIMAEISSQLDGAKSRPDDRFLFWGATNSPWKLAPRIIRRFSRRIHIPLPDYDARHEIFRINIHKKPKIDIMGDVDIPELAKLTEGYSGDDIKKLCMDAWYIPIHELVDSGEIETKNPRKVGREDFLEALRNRKPSVSPEVVASFNEWAKQWDSM
jgi:vacuolar protein-sorting-associated protein 4